VSGQQAIRCIRPEPDQQPHRKNLQCREQPVRQFVSWEAAKTLRGTGMDGVACLPRHSSTSLKRGDNETATRNQVPRGFRWWQKPGKGYSNPIFLRFR